MENKVFIPSPRKERGMGRDISAVRGGAFELLLDYNWVKNVCGGVLLCGPWAAGAL